MHRRHILTVGTIVLAGFSVAQGGDWPQFRGPAGSGLANDEKIPTEWAADKNIAWKVKVPGYGWSSPIIWKDKVIVTTAVTENQPKPAGGPGGGGGGPGGRPGSGAPGSGAPGGGQRPGGGRGAPNQVYQWEIHCLDRATGKPIWKQTALEAKPRIPTQRSNTYASETPITDGEHIYVYFGMTGLFCYDMDGKQVWKKDLGAYPMQMGWGTGSSPALAGGRLFVQCDNEEKSFIVAFDAKTGNELWREPRDERTTWSSPYIWKNKQRTELVTGGAKKIRSYDPATGKLLWELGGVNGQVNTTPIGDEERLYVGNGGQGGGGRMGGGGGPPGGGASGGGQPPAGGQRPGGGPGGGGGATLFAIKPGASGDITLKSGETSNDGVLWSTPRAAPPMASAMLYQGYIYTLDQRQGMITCVDVKTGKPAYSRERLTGARGFTSSPVAADGKIFCLDDSGQTFVIQAGPEFKLLSQNPLNEMCWSSPAVAGGAVYLRTLEALYCIKQ